MSKAEYLAERVRADAERTCSSRWRRAGDAAHLVRYEDLILEPRGDADAASSSSSRSTPGADAVRRTLRCGQPAATSCSTATARSAIRSQTIGRWRRDLPAELAAECNEILAPVLAEFGYEPEPEPPAATERR